MSGLPLTAEQRAVADAPLGSRLLVLAGAGTGKTHTLIARLRHLVEEEDVPPGSGVLVLSFTRAAVREVTNRVRKAGGDVALIRARTFDSFASQLLRAVDPDGTWAEKGYDDRIGQAIELDLGDELASYEHVVIDEIQDLVGVRADFVRRVLEQADCGFTVFGDVAQSIYNFQLGEDTDGRDFPAFLAWLKHAYADSLELRSFARNHRASSRITRAVWDVWPRLCEPDPDYPAIRRELQTIIDTGDRIHDLRLLRRYAGDASTRSAVLCRNNGTALLVSRDLHDKGIVHSLQRDATDRAVQPWLVDVFGTAQQPSMGYETFSDRYQEVVTAGMPELDDAWSVLRRFAAGAQRQQLDLQRLADNLRVGYVPDELNQESVTPLIVSTVHRSKGREFDRAVIVEDFDRKGGGVVDDLAEETRILFVAATRPRQDLFTAPRPSIGGYLKHRAGGRWVHIGYKDWQRWGIELLSRDVHRGDPPGSVIAKADPAAIQEYIARNVSTGDPLTLRALTTTGPDRGPGYYAIHHDDQLVGVTSEQFGYALRSEIRGTTSRWPREIGQISPASRCAGVARA